MGVAHRIRPGRPHTIDRGGTTRQGIAAKGFTELEELTWDEERALVEGMKRGESPARERLIRAHLRLVVAIARHFQGRGLALEDLVGEGNVGLLRAAERFDARFSVRFRTYAAHWIKQAIRHALKTTAATIRVPEHLADLVCRWQRLEGRLELAEGRRPQPERIAEALGLTPAQFKLVQLALASRTSRRAGAFRLEEGWPWGDPVDSGYEPPDAMLAIAEEREILTARLAKLSDSERIVLALRFGLDGQPRLTQKEAGRRLGLPRVDVRKLESQALKRIGAGWSRPIEAVRAVREIRCAAGLRPAGVEGRQRGSFRFLG